MMTFIKNRILLVVSAIIILFLATGAYMYGLLCFGNSCANKGAVQINKLVSNPQTLVMVDNLEVNDPKYGPESVINFQLRVISASDSEISKVTIRDIFPQYVDFNKGDGTFDQKTRTLTLDIKNMKPREVKVFSFSGKVVKNLPTSQNILCVSNRVDATVEGGPTAQDNSKFCIDKKMAAKGNGSFFLAKSPETGPESLAFFLLIPAGVLGWGIRKYSLKGNKFNN